MLEAERHGVCLYVAIVASFMSFFYIRGRIDRSISTIILFSSNQRLAMMKGCDHPKHFQRGMKQLLTFQPLPVPCLYGMCTARWAIPARYQHNQPSTSQRAYSNVHMHCSVFSSPMSVQRCYWRTCLVTFGITNQATTVYQMYIHSHSLPTLFAAHDFTCNIPQVCSTHFFSNNIRAERG